MTSRSFFEDLKKLSPPKLSNIFWGERQQKLRLALFFNMTIQFSIDFENGGVRAKLKI